MPRARVPPRAAPQHRARAIPTAAAVERYLAAWRWRRDVEHRLRRVGLTFSQWFVLDAVKRLIRDTNDAVNQNDVAWLTELDRMTVSQVMTTLAERGQVDRDTDVVGRGYRIWVTSKGEKTLALAADALTSDDHDRSG
jgi:DNA-binding MarR family transcriptional regulator